METETGTAEGRRCAAPGESALIKHLAEGAAQAGEGIKRRPNRICAFVEDLKTGTSRNTRRAPYRVARSLSHLDGESSAPPSPQCDGTSNLSKRPHPPACVRAEIRH